MKPLPLAVVSFAVAGFMFYAIYAYRHQHDGEHGYTRSAQARLLSKLEAPQPLAVQLFADDGEPVNQRIKLREWHAARHTLGKE